MLYAGALRLKLPLNGNEFLQAYVSRTEYPEWAIPCLKLFEVVEGITAYDLAPVHVLVFIFPRHDSIVLCIG